MIPANVELSPAKDWKGLWSQMISFFVLLKWKFCMHLLFGLCTPHNQANLPRLLILEINHVEYRRFPNVLATIAIAPFRVNVWNVWNPLYRSASEQRMGGKGTIGWNSVCSVQFELVMWPRKKSNWKICGDWMLIKREVKKHVTLCLAPFTIQIEAGYESECWESYFLLNMVFRILSDRIEFAFKEQ